MNWLDVVLIALVVVGALIGMKRGLLGTAFAATGMLVGWQLAGQLSDDLGGMIHLSLASDKWITIASYVVIMALATALASLSWRIVRPILTIITLGVSTAVDRLGGLAMGFILGIVIAGSLITILARLTEDFELPNVSRVPNAEQILNGQETQQQIEEALVSSTIAPLFIDITNRLPASALGFVPSDFKVSFEILRGKMTSQDDSSRTR
jgi:uncharacterized membrane protein required for colicin V production